MPAASQRDVPDLPAILSRPFVMKFCGRTSARREARF
jgi:hypothetical protein